MKKKRYKKENEDEQKFNIKKNKRSKRKQRKKVNEKDKTSNQPQTMKIQTEKKETNDLIQERAKGESCLCTVFVWLVCHTHSHTQSSYFVSSLVFCHLCDVSSVLFP